MMSAANQYYRWASVHFLLEKCYIFVNPSLLWHFHFPSIECVLSGQVPPPQPRCEVSTTLQVSQHRGFYPDCFSTIWTFEGMPGTGGHYGVMGRSQDHRSSMFGSSLNLNGEYLVTLWRLWYDLYVKHMHKDILFPNGMTQSIIFDKISTPV